MKGIESTYLYAHGGYFTVIAVGVLIIIATLVLSQLLVTIMHRALNKTTGGEVGGSIIANVIRVGVWIVGLSILLKACFDYNTAVLWGALGIGGIALSLGLQNTISNLIGGLQMSLSRDLTLGDWVTVGNITGQIKDITWRVMKVQDSSVNNYILPNAMLNTTAISVLPPYQTISLPLVFSDSIDLDSVQTDIPQIAYAALEKGGYLYEDMRPVLSIDGTDLNSVNATLAIYTSYEYSSMQIRKCVIPPIVERLRSAHALASFNG